VADKFLWPFDDLVLEANAIRDAGRGGCRFEGRFRITMRVVESKNGVAVGCDIHIAVGLALYRIQLPDDRVPKVWPYSGGLESFDQPLRTLLDRDGHRHLVRL